MDIKEIADLQSVLMIKDIKGKELNLGYFMVRIDNSNNSINVSIQLNNIDDLNENLEIAKDQYQSWINNIKNIAIEKGWKLFEDKVNK